jgi:hypothetical protein
VADRYQKRRRPRAGDRRCLFQKLFSLLRFRQSSPLTPSRTLFTTFSAVFLILPEA